MRDRGEVVKEYDVTRAQQYEVFINRLEDRKWYKRFWSWIKFHFYYRWVHLYYNQRNRLINHIAFDKLFKDYYQCDGGSQVKLFRFGLELLLEHIDKGYEIDVTRNKKVKRIKELIYLLGVDDEEEAWDKYVTPLDDKIITHVTEYSNGDIGFKTLDGESQELFDKAFAEYEQAYENAKKKRIQRIFKLLEGQYQSDVRKLIDEKVGQREDYDNLEEYSKKVQEAYNEVFDGTGIMGWWN